MSQKEGRFQSKSGKFGGGGKGKGRPGGGGFGKRFEGDKGGKRFESRGGSDRPFKKPFRERSEGAGGDRPFKKPFRERSEGAGGDRPFKKPFRERSEGGFKGREGGGGDRPFKKPFRERSEGGYKGRDDRGAGGGDRPFKKPFRERSEGGYKGREDRGGGGDRPFKKPFRERSEGGDFKPREGGFKGREDRGGGDRPFKKPFRERSEGGDFKPREDRGGFRSRDGGDRPFKKPFRERSEGGGDFKPREDRGGFKSREGGFKGRDDRGGGGGFKSRDGGGFKGRPGADRDERPRGDRHKPYKRNFENRDFVENRGRKPFRATEEGAGDDFGLPNEAAEVSDVSPFETREAAPDTRQRLKSDRPGYGAPSSAYLYGVHAVRAALQNSRRTLQRLLVTENGYETIREAYEAATNAGLKLPEPTYVQTFDIERLLPRDAVHQGVLLDSQPAEEVFLSDILLTAPEHAKILVLDQVTDPHNVGAILRSAAVFGAIAVVVQKLHAPDITGTLAKSASGAAELVPMVKEVNLTRALEQMKEAGFFCIGLAEEGKETLSVLAPTGKVALVLGAEGEGLRRLVSETCDTLAKLPTSGAMSSLNVSNAAAVALYELTRGQ